MSDATCDEDCLFSQAELNKAAFTASDTLPLAPDDARLGIDSVPIRPKRIAPAYIDWGTATVGGGALWIHRMLELSSTMSVGS